MGYGAPVIGQTITAQAAEAESYRCLSDETTGVLTLRGEVDRNAVSKYRNIRKLRSVAAEEGTVFPEDGSGLFSSDFS